MKLSTMIPVFAVLILTSPFSFPSTTNAMTPEEKAEFTQMQADINDGDKSEANWPKDKCGAAIPITIDPAMHAPFKKSGRNLSAECEAVRSKIGTMCRNDEESLNNGNKAKLFKAVKAIQCKLGTGEDVKFAMKGTTLIATLGPKCSNVSDLLTPWLVKSGIAVGMD